MRDLHDLPRFSDRWSHLYLERGRLEKEKNGLTFYTAEGSLAIPIDQLAMVLMGPGSTVSHAAMRSLADNNTLVCWTGEQGVRLYAHSTGGTHHSSRLLRQAALYSDYESRLAVIRRMYGKRFAEPLPEGASLETVRGKEGYRVREAYRSIAEEFGIPWHGRSYRQHDWDWSDPINRALSSAYACLYGICHAAILSAGYSPSIGFIHTGKMLSFVYDIADLYKTEVAVPTAFRVIKEGEGEVERRARMACRDIFHQTKLIKRILPDIAEVLDARDDLGESPGELEGRVITLADRAEDGSLPWQSECESEKPSLAEDD